MRILFLCHYFPPEVNAPANRTFEHARRWAADGHDVTVITGVPNHPHGKLFDGYRNRFLSQEEQIEGIRVIRTWMYLAANRGFARRILNYLLFASTAILASFRAERPDVVVATSPQFFCGLAGAVVARLKRRPFVLEVRDLWPESILQLGQLENSLIIGALERLETWLYRSAAGIVINTPAFADHIVARGVDRDRIILVHNGIDRALFQPRDKDAEVLREYALEGRTVVGYIGTMGLAQGVGTVLEVATLMRDRKDLAFVLIGDGNDRPMLEQTAREQGLDNLRILGLQPRARIPALIASCDVLLVLLRDLPVFETVIPSKLFEFLAQERPIILSSPPGEARRLVAESGGGLCLDAEQPAALVVAIDTLMASPERSHAMARSGREWVLENFDRDVLARKMAAFLEQIVRAAA